MSPVEIIFKNFKEKWLRHFSIKGKVSINSTLVINTSRGWGGGQGGSPKHMIKPNEHRQLESLNNLITQCIWPGSSSNPPWSSIIDVQYSTVFLYSLLQCSIAVVLFRIQIILCPVTFSASHNRIGYYVSGYGSGSYCCLQWLSRFKKKFLFFLLITYRIYCRYINISLKA